MSAVAYREVVNAVLREVGLDAKPAAGRGKVVGTVWAKEQPCFGLRTYASGRRVYIVQARMQGRVRTITICNAALASRSRALDVARRVLLRAQVGEDPAVTRQRSKAIPPFDRFLDLYWERMAPKWKPSTRRTHDVYRQAHLQGAFGQKSVDKISAADLADWFARTASRGGVGCANRALDILRAAFNKAEAWGLREANSNPASGLKPYPQQRFARSLRPEELARLGAALDGEANAFPLHVAAIRLLILTGCRHSEITGLLWSEVVGSRLRLTDSKTGPRTVWLGAEAQEILRRLPQSFDEIFTEPGAGRAIKVGEYWRHFRERSGFEGLRLHDLRHSFASHAASMSETLPMIGLLLGHAELQSTARYAQVHDLELIGTAQRIGDALESAIGT